MKFKSFMKSLPMKIFLTIVLLAGSMATVTALWNQVGQVDAVIETSEQPVVDQSETVDVTFKYYATTGMNDETVVAAAIYYDSNNKSYVDVTTNTLALINELVGVINTFLGTNTLSTYGAGTSEETRTAFPAGTHEYTTKTNSDDGFDHYLVLEVRVATAIQIKTTDEGCLQPDYQDTYSGKYSLYVREIKRVKDTTIFSDSIASYETLTLYKNSTITLNQVLSLLQPIDSDYYFSGLAYSTTDSAGALSIDTSKLYDYETAITTDTTFYAMFNKNNADIGTLLTDQVNSNTGTLTVSSGPMSDYNIANDFTYFSGLNSVALGNNKTKTTISAGSTVNLVNNSGILVQVGTTRLSYVPEPEATSNCQYTVVLQSDLTINGTMQIGGCYGQNGTNGTQGSINGAYVCLDLNGHDIYINYGGTLLSYGLIKDTIGTGRILNNGGTMKTLAIFYDAKGGQSTVLAVNKYNIFPFSIYSIPYLRCRYIMTYNSTNSTWGAFVAMSSVYLEGSNNVELNFVGDAGSSTAYLFALNKPTNVDTAQFEFSYSRIDAIRTEEFASDRAYYSSDEYGYCLDIRERFSFYNVDFTFAKLTMEVTVVLTVTIDSSEMRLSIPSFIDLYFYNSSIAFTQTVLFHPGVTFYADANSTVIFSGSARDKCAQLYVLDKPIKYWKNGNFIDDDNEVNTTDTFIAPFFQDSKKVWKYLDAAKIDCYGKIFFDRSYGTSSSTPYIIAGNANFAEVGYVSSVSNYVSNKSSFTSYPTKTFFNTYAESSAPYIRTYGLEFNNFHAQGSSSSSVVLGGSATSGFFYRGYSMAMTSFMTSYIYDNTSSSNIINMSGIFDSQTGIFTDSDTNQTYYFSTYVASGDASKFDDRSIALHECEVLSNNMIYDATSGNTSGYYVRFSGIHCKVTSDNPASDTDGIVTVNTYRLNLTEGNKTVYYDSTAECWGRSQ